MKLSKIDAHVKNLGLYALHENDKDTSKSYINHIYKIASIVQPELVQRSSDLSIASDFAYKGIFIHMSYTFS